MGSLVTKAALDFSANAVLPDGAIKEGFKLSSFKGRYVVLFFYPMDFTFVCPTEILAFDAELGEFEKRNVQVIGVSVDSEYSHHAWREQERSKGGIGKIGFPLVADITKRISADYGVLLDRRGPARLLLIDKSGLVRRTDPTTCPWDVRPRRPSGSSTPCRPSRRSARFVPRTSRKAARPMQTSQRGKELYFTA